MIENIIHPGLVKSKNDGDIHFITYRMLVRLYHLDPKTCIRFGKTQGMDTKNMKHYFPRPDGNYG